MPAELYHGFPLSERREWDASAEEPKLKQWASSDGSGDKETIDWNKLRKAYFWHEAGKLSEFGQLKFPYCRIEDGSPHVVHNAVQNALARIDGSNIPAEDKPAVRRVAERQMDRFQDEEGESRAGAFSRQPRQFGFPTPSQLEKINRLAKRPLSAEEVFVFGAKLVGDMLIPNRYIKMDKSLLQVFKQDAQNGVAFMLDHPWAGFFARPKPALGYGRTFDAALKKSQGVEGETWALYADHYLVRGKEKDGISTDAIIADIEDGTLFDTSIGWGADIYKCSICGNDIRDYQNCPHWPGKTYEVDGEQLLCYVIAKPPGFLMENSGVFDGAYPTAGMLSQGGGVEQKEGYVEVADLKKAPLDAKLYHIYSANKGSLVTFMRQASAPDKKMLALSAAGGNSLKGDENVSGNANDPKTYIQEQVDALVKEAVEKAQATHKEAMDKVLASAKAATEPPEVFMTQEQSNVALGKEYSAEAVLKFAKEGVDYHSEVVGEAIAWGVRAQGNDFPAETWKATFGAMGTKAIKDLMATFKSQAEQDLPAGRQTDAEAGKGFQVKPQIPDEAYKA